MYNVIKLRTSCIIIILFILIDFVNIIIMVYNIQYYSMWLSINFNNVDGYLTY